MNTEELIGRLARDAGPVRPLPRPWKRAAVWLACAVAYLGAVAGVAYLRRSRLAVTADPLYVVQQIAFLVTGVTAAVAAFVSVIPGTSRRVAAAPLVPGGVLAAALVVGCMRDFQRVGAFGVGSQTDWPCVVSITLGGGLLWGAIAAMLRRGAALSPSVTGLLGGIAALSIANVEACLTRGHAFTSIVLMWHGATTLAMVTILALLGRRAFSWPRAEDLRT